MNTLFAVIALPPTNNTNDLAQLMLHNSFEAARANAAYVSGQVTPQNFSVWDMLSSSLP